MPAVGVVVDNVASGIQTNVYTEGSFQLTSGLADFSGYLGTRLFVGRSGQIVSTSGSFNSGGLVSGDTYQGIGTAYNSGAFVINVGFAQTSDSALISSGEIASGSIGQFSLASGAVNSGHIGNAAVVSGSIASGQIGSAHIASGGVLSGNIASGQIGAFHLASGVLAGATLGSGQVTSGTIASGQVGQFHLSSGAVNSGHIGNNAVVSGSIASGQIGSFHIASGGVQSGNIASGQIGRFHLASGAVNSGHIGNNAVVSGSVGSGQIGQIHLAPNTINNISGNLSVTSGTTTTQTLVLNSTIFSGLASTSGYVVYSGALSIGAAAYFYYAAKNVLNSGHRAGTIISTWDSAASGGLGMAEFNEISTLDLGGTTAGLSFATSVLSGNLQLTANVAAGTYNIKIGGTFI
jgi:hypothetical protein